MTMDGFTQIVNFMDPWGRGCCAGARLSINVVKMHYFFRILFLYSQAYFRQTESVPIMTEKGSTKIVNFKTPVAEVLVLGHGDISHIVKCIILLKIFFSILKHR